MANILSSNLQGRDSTPVLPVEFNLASSLQGEAEFAIDKIIVQTDKHLRKEGGFFFVDNERIDLETLNILDLLILLRSKGINVGFINSSDYWYYPALCILDFSNEELCEIKMTHTPFTITPYKQIRSLTITPLESVNSTVMNVFDFLNSKVVPFTQTGDLISVGKFFEQNAIVIMLKSTSKKFLLKVDNKFTSDKIDTVSRYLEVPSSND